MNKHGEDEMGCSGFDGRESAGLVLDAASHRYTFDGQRVPGVTEIITGLGIVDARWFKEYDRDRGQAVHLAMQLLVQGRLDWTSVDARILPYVQAGEKFINDAGVVIGDPQNLTEHLVMSRAYWYAGKLDLAAPMFGKLWTLVDFKSGGLGCAKIQTAAYEEPLREELGLKKPMRRMAVQLKADGRYSISEYKDSRDHQHWCACALVYRNYLMDKRRDDGA